jgi:enamine deaminase RidA (YjgF/YER057c/UK114 family)
VLGEHRPASTAVVKALLKPEWLIEIAVIAVK